MTKTSGRLILWRVYSLPCNRNGVLAKFGTPFFRFSQPDQAALLCKQLNSTLSISSVMERGQASDRI
ncbi:hypothetical protein COMA2_100145 [Candidatus Nitrospira nitrificans]|uniref:Uncharacterized protein n=1 Tax=Candidatus Nitrospira nitrificans TaxID=1742973 RepID=A0A0S4L4Q3_9BACT|nr:hypothetical protein COMA2_100145 [Candidatus Nitrospira nitrificans]